MKNLRWHFRHGYWTPARAFGKKLLWGYRTQRIKILPRKLLSPIERFIRDGWNEVLYQSALVGEGEHIFVFGAHLGDSTQDWLSRFKTAQLHCFEPVESFAEICSHRFGDTRQVEVFPYSVGPRREIRNFFSAGDMTTGIDTRITEGYFPGNFGRTLGHFRDIQTELPKWPSEIAVLEVNIEGGEFELLQTFGSAGAIARFRQIFIQFHDVGEATSESIEKAVNLLEKTHVRKFSYPFVWELWIRK